MNKIKKGVNYTYILKCADGSLYTGWTNDLAKRVEDHNAGRGAKYTKGRGPVTLVYYEASETKEAAMRREFFIKQLTRDEKQKMILAFDSGCKKPDRKKTCHQVPVPGTRHGRSS